MQELEFHPAADAFPMMDDKRFDELLADIRTHGQREPITIADGMVLDGRNRYKALTSIGITPRVKDFDGDPWSYAWSLNGQRRDLVAEQRYLIWKFCNESSQSWQDQKRSIDEAANRKRSEAAKVQHEHSNPRSGERLVVQHSVVEPDNPRKGQSAKATASKTNPGAVARGDKLAKDRPDLAEKVRMGTIKPADAHREMKRAEHAEKVAVAQTQPREATETRTPQVVLADPPWRYDHQQAENRAIENHYCTATQEEICGHAPDTEPDAVLFLWATAPKLLEALEVLTAWGFTYKTQAVWDKEKQGMGYWFRGQHEVLLVGTKGAPGATPECERVASVFREARGRHSKKPQCVYEWIERAFPDKSKLEMYCRAPRDGWSVWGNEV